MKVFFAMIALLSSVSAFALEADVVVRAGDSSYTHIPQCGADARVKAVYSRAAGDVGHLVLRMCDNTLCQYPVLLNTNSSFRVSGDGKTEIFASQSEGRRLNASCYEFQMHNPTETPSLRARIGSDSWVGNAVNIQITQ